jgi:hypothetical protein
MNIPTIEEIDQMSRSEKHNELVRLTCAPRLDQFEQIIVLTRINYILRKLGASTHDDIELFGGDSVGRE